MYSLQKNSVIWKNFNTNILGCSPSSSSMPTLILKRIYLAYSALKESEELQKLSKSTKYEAGAGRLREKESGKLAAGKGGLFGVSICVL